MRIRAFKGLRPTTELADQVASLPYDVVSTEEARALAKNKPYSMLHIVRAEIDLPEGTDPYSDAVYAQSAKNLQKLQEEGVLIREKAPCLYVYQQKMGDHVQKGLVCTCLVEDYDQGLIKKHEKTRQNKEDDRTRLTSELSANSGPVFLTYENQESIDALVDEAIQDAPLYDFAAEDGIQHTVWKIDAPQAIIDAFSPIPSFYVADGHHRSASAARVGRERREANPNHTGEEAYNQFLCVLFPDNQLKVLPYNRLIEDLNGHSIESFLEAVRKVTTVRESNADAPEESGKACMYINGQWYELGFDIPEGADPVERLDVSQLQDKILAPLLDIQDPRTSERVDFVGGIRGTSYLKEKVDAGNAAVAFSMYPTTVKQLIDIADADKIMPPKSTWFEPKLRSGLLIHTF